METQECYHILEDSNSLSTVCTAAESGKAMLTSKPHRTEVGKASRKSWDSDSPLGVARSWVVLLTLMRVFKMGKIRETEKGKCRVNLGEHLTTDHSEITLDDDENRGLSVRS